MFFAFESSSLITLFVGENFSLVNFRHFSPLFVGENFRPLAKISSLFPDEFFPDTVVAGLNRTPMLTFLSLSLRVEIVRFIYFQPYI